MTGNPPLLWLKCWTIWKTKMCENTHLYRIHWRERYFTLQFSILFIQPVDTLIGSVWQLFSGAEPWQIVCKISFKVHRWLLIKVLLVPWTENHLSSFKCGFLNISSRQNLLRSLSRQLFLLRWNKYGAKKCLKNHIPFNFWDDSTLANQGTGKTTESLRRSFHGTNKAGLSSYFRLLAEQLLEFVLIITWIITSHLESIYRHN